MLASRFEQFDDLPALEKKLFGPQKEEEYGPHEEDDQKDDWLPEHL